MKFLCASDLHLGRSPAGIPEHLGLDEARLATSTVWDALVEHAVAERVDAVLLAGNVIDRENRLFEPLGPFETGLVALARNGIPVYAVGGDHDFDTLRRLVASEEDAPSNLHLIGRDGRWEAVPLPSAGDPALTLLGWSAPARSHGATPLARFAMPEHRDRPVVALFHASIAEEHGQPGDYAPVTRNELAGWPVDLWIAGHGHTPLFSTDDVVPLLKPGSGSPLDPGERGPRGAWLVEIDQTDTERVVEARHLPLAPVRFSDVEVDVSGADTAEVEARIVAAMRDALSAAVLSDPAGHLVCLACNVTVRGTTAAHAAVPSLVRELTRTIDVQDRSVVAAIASVAVETRPPIDLEPLLERPDAVGEVARLLRDLEPRPDTVHHGVDDLPASTRHLLVATATRLQAVHRAQVFDAVASDPEPDVAAAATLLHREAWTALDALIQQRGMD